VGWCDQTPPTHTHTHTHHTITISDQSNSFGQSDPVEDQLLIFIFRKPPISLLLLEKSAHSRQDQLQLESEQLQEPTRLILESISFLGLTI
jgi:hypothetical protein